MGFHRKYEKTMKKAKSAWGGKNGGGDRWRCYVQTDKVCKYIERAYANGEVTGSDYYKYKREAEELHAKVVKEMIDDGGIR